MREGGRERGSRVAARTSSFGSLWKDDHPLGLIFLFLLRFLKSWMYCMQSSEIHFRVGLLLSALSPSLFALFLSLSSRTILDPPFLSFPFSNPARLSLQSEKKGVNYSLKKAIQDSASTTPRIFSSHLPSSPSVVSIRVVVRSSQERKKHPPSSVVRCCFVAGYRTLSHHHLDELLFIRGSMKETKGVSSREERREREAEKKVSIRTA